jgi:hypothetical protein
MTSLLALVAHASRTNTSVPRLLKKPQHRLHDQFRRRECPVHVESDPVIVRPVSDGTASTWLRIVDLTIAVFSVGLEARMSAAAPATCGVAIEVPLIDWYQCYSGCSARRRARRPSRSIAA